MPRRIIAVTLLLFSQALLAASESPSYWLERMVNSVRDMNYRGIFTYDRGNRMESLRVAHAVFNGEEFERLQYLDGDHREILRRGEQVSCFQPGQKLVRFFQQQQHIKNSQQQQALLTQYYDLQLTGNGRVAGRETVQLSIKPLDQHRYGYELAVDKQTGLVLKLKMLGPQQTVLERFQFVELEVNSAIPQDFFQHSEDDGKQLPVAAARTMAYRWQASWSPAGFVAMAGQDQPYQADMQTYSDGLAAYSIFVEPFDSAKLAPHQTAQRGATVVHSRRLSSAGAVVQVTVVGEIPQATAELLAQSVELIQ
jgi:sigma-E factor negative regulatory protein RseB